MLFEDDCKVTPPLASVHPEPFGKLRTGLSKDSRSTRWWFDRLTMSGWVRTLQSL